MTEMLTIKNLTTGDCIIIRDGVSSLKSTHDVLKYVCNMQCKMLCKMEIQCCTM